MELFRRLACAPRIRRSRVRIPSPAIPFFLRSRTQELQNLVLQNFPKNIRTHFHPSGMIKITVQLFGAEKKIGKNEKIHNFIRI